jgi:hypothetical protein
MFNFKNQSQVQKEEENQKIDLFILYYIFIYVISYMFILFL